jgi:hypothetical protein
MSKNFTFILCSSFCAKRRVVAYASPVRRSHPESECLLPPPYVPTGHAQLELMRVVCTERLNLIAVRLYQFPDQ